MRHKWIHLGRTWSPFLKTVNWLVALSWSRRFFTIRKDCNGSNSSMMYCWIHHKWAYNYSEFCIDFADSVRLLLILLQWVLGLFIMSIHILSSVLILLLGFVYHKYIYWVLCQFCCLGLFIISTYILCWFCGLSLCTYIKFYVDFAAWVCVHILSSVLILLLELCT